MTGVVSIESVSKTFGHNQVIKDVSLDIAEGEVVSIIGPSGSGKSTLIRMVNGLTSYDSGQIHVDGTLVSDDRKSLSKVRRASAMVFQQFNLFPHLTVLNNVALGPRNILGLPKAEANERAQRLLDEVGIGQMAERHPESLSGGQQQRVAIARALAMQPRVLLFDEPTSALDPEMVGEVLNVIKKLATTSGTTMLVVTHEMAFARDVSDTIVFIDKGVVVERGDAKQVIDEPSHERTATFLRRVLGS